MTGEGTTSADSSAQARAVRASITAAAATAVPTGTSTHAKPSGEKFPPILHASVDWRPDEDTDVRVRIDSRPLQVVLHPALLLRLARFFQSPGAHGLRAALVTRLRAIQTRTTAELLAVLAENRQLDVLVNVAAPYVELVCVWQCPGSSVVCLVHLVCIQVCHCAQVLYARYGCCPRRTLVATRRGSGQPPLCKSAQDRVRCQSYQR